MKNLKSVELLLLDVDGVLTDGSIIYDDNFVEIKTFNVKDGLGIRLLIEHGINVGIVTGRRSKALSRRCEDLGIDLIYDGVKDKAGLLGQITKRTGVDARNMAFVGDDLPDIALMKQVGFSIAVSDAHETVINIADMVTIAKGGFGAVREVCEAILRAKDLWAWILKQDYNALS
ncbi:MAG TPA: phenylphosphate carboxylase subunit delta [Desulfobacteraceae bacterium]|nr:phenylphosphate carboxylase subunit delta [Desulfobacteraceae bacterium]